MKYLVTSQHNAAFNVLYVHMKIVFSIKDIHIQFDIACAEQ